MASANARRSDSAGNVVFRLSGHWKPGGRPSAAYGLRLALLPEVSKSAWARDFVKKLAAEVNNARFEALFEDQH